MKSAQCSFCAKAYRYRPNKRYCSDKCRFQAWIRGKVEPDVTPCYYCGMPADTIDHVPPRCVRADLMHLNEKRWAFVEVDACHECNCLLGASPPWTIHERKKKIKEKLKKRYRKYMKLPDWTDQEMEGLDEKSVLRKYVHEGMILKRATQQRLAW